MIRCELFHSSTANRSRIAVMGGKETGLPWQRACAVLIASLALSLQVAACGRGSQPRPEDARNGGAAQQHGENTPCSLERGLAEVATADVVFSDGALRSRFEMRRETSEDGWYAHSFALKQQPGMDPNRHFLLIGVSFRAGDASGPGDAASASTGGPAGGFTHVTGWTHDHRYVVRVSEGVLLPNTVDVPSLDIEQILARILDAYHRCASPRES
jgi:hypothetical protein